MHQRKESTSFHPFARLGLSLGLCVILLLGGNAAWAAITGSISGVVTDPSGAVIPGVTVVATAQSTNVKNSAVTDAKGFYSFPLLSVDVYDITVNQQGYRDYSQTGVKINANSAVRIDIPMQLGSVTNTVNVKSDALQVETQSTQMGMVIQDTKITSVPLNGRSYLQLLNLQPGVSPYTQDSTTSGVGATTLSGDQTNGTQSVNGGRVGSNAFMVNGANAEEEVHNGAAVLPNLDSIAQFRIITNNFDAEYGNYSGGQVNVVTKSGTNQIHGTVFDFLRNTDLDARNYFAPSRGVFIQNQFGGTVGGPIKKDKIFWFSDYQGTRQILGATQSYGVPSQADRTGNLMDLASTGAFTGTVNGTNFANILSQGTGNPVAAGEPYYSTGCAAATSLAQAQANPAGYCVFPGAVIPQSAWSPVALAELKYVPQPNNSNGTFSTSAYNATLHDDKGGFRIDMPTRFGALFGYYFLDRFNTINPYSQVNVPGFAAGNDGMTQMVNLGLTTTFSSSTVNDIRLVYLRDVNHTGIPQSGQGLGVTLASQGFNTPWGPSGGISAIKPAYEGVANLMFNNFQFGVPPDALNQYNNTFQIIDNVTKVIGTHTVQFGGNAHYDQINERNYDCYNGCFSFNGAETGVDFADFLIGAPANFTQASQQLLDSRSKYYGFYVQDSWRALHTLTINYGLRWEVASPWYDTQNKLETVVLGEQSQAFPTAPEGLVVPGDPGIPRTLGPTRYGNFAPRIGLAYAPDVQSGFLRTILGGAGKSSIRAGYGIFYSSIEDATGFVEVGDAPYGDYFSTSNYPSLASPFIVRSTGASLGVKFPFVFPPTNVSPKNPDTTFDWASATPISGSDYYYPKNKMPYVQQFEFSIQRQFGTATVLTTSYVGAVGRDLLTFEESNPGNQALCLQLSNPANLQPGETPCGPYGEDTQYTLANGSLVNGTRPFGLNFGSNPYMKTAVSSSYNSFQVSLEHTEKYLNFLVGYTYAKSLDNGSDSFDATNPFNPSQTRALSFFNVPQNLVVSYTLSLPFNNFIGKSNFGQYFTAGWQLSGVSTFAKGEPIQLSEQDDNSLMGAFDANVDVPNLANNGGPLIISKNPRTGLPYFNPNTDLATPYANGPQGYFQSETIGQVGNAMRRFFSGPGLDNYDMALLKATKITEGTNLQFRAEAFNVFNHAQFNNPSGNINNTGFGGFGYVTTANNPRIMQIALKLNF